MTGQFRKLSCSKLNQKFMKPSTSLPIVNIQIPLWRKIQRSNFTQLDALLDFLEMSEEKRQKFYNNPNFVLNLPKRLAKKIEKNTLNDPILKQFVPLIEETHESPGYVLDPVQDCTFRKTEKLLHKYEGRALIISTSACAMHLSLIHISEPTRPY